MLQAPLTLRRLPPTCTRHYAAGTRGSDADSAPTSRSTQTMTIERTLRGIAGFFILLSLGLSWGLGQVDLATPSWL